MNISKLWFDVTIEVIAIFTVTLTAVLVIEISKQNPFEFMIVYLNDPVVTFFLDLIKVDYARIL